MKNSLLFCALILSSTLFSAFSSATETKEKIKWYTWEEAIQANQTNPKKLFVDVYTDWCGWCKRMDKSTFSDPEVVKFVNEHFYAIKLNAEQREKIQYNDHTFNFVEAGRKGYHELAYSLLDGRMGYPAFVYLDETEKRITVSPGYKDVDGIMVELTFIAEDHFKTSKFDDFKANYKSK